MLKLIASKTSPYARKVRVALAEKKIEYQMVETSGWAPGNPVHAWNPLGKLPVLILDDVPLLSKARNNEAKRFVTLIDALYEAKVRLVCSAAAPPEMLYQEGEGAFEFERTASRLHEMRSAGWGGAKLAALAHV